MNIFCSLSILALKAELLLILKNDERAGKRITLLFGIPQFFPTALFNMLSAIRGGLSLVSFSVIFPLLCNE